MYLTVHSALGALVGQATGNPVLAFAGGFISHLCIDIIPHGDSERSGISWTRRTLLLVGCVDALIVIVGTTGLMYTAHVTPGIGVIAGIAGSMAPDALQLPHVISHGTRWLPYMRFHNFFHNLISHRFDFDWRLGIVLQGVLLSIFLYVLVT